MKTLSLILFGAVALAQWAAPLSQIWTYEQALAHGALIKLKCSAPDPYDPLRGRYLAVSPSQQAVDVPAGVELQDGAQVYGTLTTGADGLATITSLSLTPPTSGDYIMVKTRYVYESKASIDWPFERFYINEKLAPEADVWLAENISTASGVTAEVRVLKGRAVLADLSVGGKSFREILKQRVK